MRADSIQKYQISMLPDTQFDAQKYRLHKNTLRLFARICSELRVTKFVESTEFGTELHVSRKVSQTLTSTSRVVGLRSRHLKFTPRTFDG